ncbi:MAG: hypothetical protein EZS28_021045 [Streblomastix strix]|uniref:Uncharacterized protein n=1 Tax=Streblomastix strix TaxID=222440 RepID=A0A5J4VLA9_9EUKA|nr:MAG: hypothetical protein EZS28_021045 [Streblomastix strix]
MSLRSIAHFFITRLPYAAVETDAPTGCSSLWVEHQKTRKQEQSQLKTIPKMRVHLVGRFSIRLALRAQIRITQSTFLLRNWIQTFFNSIVSQRPLQPLTLQYNAPYLYHSFMGRSCKYWKALPERSGGNATRSTSFIDTKTRGNTSSRQTTPAATLTIGALTSGFLIASSTVLGAWYSNHLTHFGGQPI